MGILSSAAGVISGLLNKGGVSAPDLSALFKTIGAAGTRQKGLINALPAELKPLYDEYIASTNQASDELKSGTSDIAERLKRETEANFGPEVTQEALKAVKREIYGELPGQQAAIRQALAATGGFDRGTASKQLAAPVLQAASKYGTEAAKITTQQLQAKQQATQQAINTVASLNDQALREAFGMSKDQALQILNGNRTDLKDQLADLINQSNNETNQTLGVQSDVAMNNYRKAIADKAQGDAMTNSIVNLGADVIGGASGFMSGLDINSPVSQAPANYNPNMAANQIARLGY